MCSVRTPIDKIPKTQPQETFAPKIDKSILRREPLRATHIRTLKSIYGHFLKVYKLVGDTTPEEEEEEYVVPLDWYKVVGFKTDGTNANANAIAWVKRNLSPAFSRKELLEGEYVPRVLISLKALLSTSQSHRAKFEEFGVIHKAVNGDMTLAELMEHIEGVKLYNSITYREIQRYLIANFKQSPHVEEIVAEALQEMAELKALEEKEKQERMNR